VVGKKGKNEYFIVWDYRENQPYYGNEFCTYEGSFGRYDFQCKSDFLNHINFNNMEISTTGFWNYNNSNHDESIYFDLGISNFLLNFFKEKNIKTISPENESE
jgi:hypothetical protein